VKHSDIEIAKEELTAEIFRRKYANDPFGFARDVLDYTSFKDYPHGELFKFLSQSIFKPKNGKMVLMPRGSFKTICVHALLVHKILYNPNIRILYFGSTWGKSVLSVSTVKAHLEKNPLIQRFFGFQGKKNGANKWTDDAFVVAGRTKYSFKEATMSASGVETSTTGLHYDLIVFDDIHDPENTKNFEQIENVRNHFMQGKFLLDSSGEMWVIGTRWNLFDLYGWIIKNMKDFFSFYVKTCYDGPGSPTDPDRLDDPQFTPNESTLLLPEVLDFQTLRSYKVMQPEDFSGHMMNRAISPEMNPFKQEDMRTWEREGELPVITDKFLTIDLASSSKKSSDYTALIVGGWCTRNKLWVLDAVREHMDEKLIADTIFELCQKHGLDTYGAESGALLNYLEPFMQNEMANRGVYLISQPLKGWHGTSKEERIRRLIPFWKNHAIILRKDMDELQYQLLIGGEHDDLKDALAYQIEMHMPTSITEEEIRSRDAETAEEMESARQKKSNEIMMSQIESDLAMSRGGDFPVSGNGEDW